MQELVIGKWQEQYKVRMGKKVLPYAGKGDCFLFEADGRLTDAYYDEMNKLCKTGPTWVKQQYTYLCRNGLHFYQTEQGELRYRILEVNETTLQLAWVDRWGEPQGIFFATRLP